MEITVDLTEKLLLILEKIDEESRTILQDELMKVVPSEESEVILKAGGGRFPDDNEWNIGIFVQVTPPQTNPEPQTLDLLIRNIVQLAETDTLEVVDEVLTGFETALPPYKFLYTDAQMVNETIGAFHFSLIGKLN